MEEIVVKNRLDGTPKRGSWEETEQRKESRSEITDVAHSEEWCEQRVLCKGAQRTVVLVDLTPRLQYTGSYRNDGGYLVLANSYCNYWLE